MKKWFLNNYKNYICLVVAIIFLAFASVFFNNSHFGSDSIFALNQGVSKLIKVSVGTTNIIIGVIAFIILLIIDKKAIGVGSVLMALTMGMFINLIMKIGIVPDLASTGLPTILDITLKLLYIFIAIALGGFGIALYIYANRGISPIEGIIIKIQKVTKMPFWLVKIINDVLFYLVGFILGATINVGSVFAAFLYGPVISLFTKMLNKIDLLGEVKNVEQNKKKEHKNSKRNKSKKNK